MAAPTTRKCATCRFWEMEDKGFGLCHRNAPSPTILAGEGDKIEAVIVWPKMGKDDWCGEHGSLQ